MHKKILEYILVLIARRLDMDAIRFSWLVSRADPLRSALISAHAQWATSEHARWLDAKRGKGVDLDYIHWRERHNRRIADELGFIVTRDGRLV